MSKATFIPIPVAVNVRALKYCQAAKLLVADANVPKSQVSLHDLNFIIDHKHCRLFPLKCHAQVSHFLRICLPIYASLNHTAWPSVILSNNCGTLQGRGPREAASWLKAQIIPKVMFLKSLCRFIRNVNLYS